MATSSQLAAGPVLVTGATGLLGAHVMESFGARGRVAGIDRHPWWGDRPAEIVIADLLDEEAVERAMRSVRPGVVVHCAALADVDACEDNPALAHRYNAEMTHRLARAAGPDCLFVYIATDGIFAGDRAFTSEDQAPQPRTVYAQSKLRGEEAVRAAAPNHLIVRTNFYGWSSGRKRTSAEWLIQALEAEQDITLFDDFFFTPLYVVDFVDHLTRLMKSPFRGTVHLCGRERVSKHEFGLAMGELAGLSTSAVRRGSIDAAQLKAHRPKDMSLNCQRFLDAVGGELPDMRAGLRRFLADRGRPLSARLAARVDSA
jgi:dTDP-4-dehydrorhamnose reductase